MANCRQVCFLKDTIIMEITSWNEETPLPKTVGRVKGSASDQASIGSGKQSSTVSRASVSTMTSRNAVSTSSSVLVSSASLG